MYKSIRYVMELIKNMSEKDIIEKTLDIVKEAIGQSDELADSIDESTPENLPEESNEDIEKEDVQWESEVLKANDEKQIVTGVVIRSEQADLEGDFFPTPVVEEAAFKFMKESRTVGISHTAVVDDAYVVESYLSPTDFEVDGHRVNKNDWVMSVKIENDKLWSEVKKGNLNAFSIGGRARKISIDNK